MARTKNPNAEPGRIKQMWSVFQMTRRYDKLAIWYLLLGLLLPIVIGVGLALTIANGSIISIVVYILLGVMAGILAFLIILGRRAERLLPDRGPGRRSRGRAQEFATPRMAGQRDAHRREPAHAGRGLPRGRPWRGRPHR
jgi:hypothetical protein